MTKLTIDTGLREYEINGRGVLRFNPGDPNLYHRFFAAQQRLAALDEALTADLAAAGKRDGEGGAVESLLLLAEYDGKIKALLGELFGPGNDFDALLDGVNLAGLGVNGRRVVQNLLDALAPVLQAGAENAVRALADQAAADAEADRRARTGGGGA